jgi:hypothetical protein
MRRGPVREPSRQLLAPPRRVEPGERAHGVPDADDSVRGGSGETGRKLEHPPVDGRLPRALPELGQE